jgi:hypothetical protein
MYHIWKHLFFMVLSVNRCLKVSIISAQVGRKGKVIISLWAYTLPGDRADLASAKFVFNSYFNTEIRASSKKIITADVRK